MYDNNEKEVFLYAVGSAVRTIGDRAGTKVLPVPRP
jgi:hypothetical protein